MTLEDRTTYCTIEHVIPLIILKVLTRRTAPIHEGVNGTIISLLVSVIVGQKPTHRNLLEGTGFPKVGFIDALIILINRYFPGEALSGGSLSTFSFLSVIALLEQDRLLKHC